MDPQLFHISKRKGNNILVHYDDVKLEIEVPLFKCTYYSPNDPKHTSDKHFMTLHTNNQRFVSFMKKIEDLFRQRVGNKHYYVPLISPRGIIKVKLPYKNKIPQFRVHDRSAEERYMTSTSVHIGDMCQVDIELQNIWILDNGFKAGGLWLVRDIHVGEDL